MKKASSLKAVFVSDNVTTAENSNKNIKLTDLCLEDKQKIGELANKLSEVKEDRRILEEKLAENARGIDEDLMLVFKKNQKILKEVKDLKFEFENSLKIIEKERTIRYPYNPVPIDLLENTHRNQFKTRALSNISTEFSSFHSRTPTIVSKSDTSCDNIFYHKPNCSFSHSSTQTPKSKQIQTSIFVPKLNLTQKFETVSNSEFTFKQSRALKEVKSLQNDICLLSRGMKEMNQKCADSMKNSQILGNKISVFDDKSRSMKPSDFFRQLNAANFCNNKENINPVQMLSKYVCAQEDIVMDDTYYDEHLFELIQEIDK